MQDTDERWKKVKETEGEGREGDVNMGRGVNRTQKCKKTKGR